MRTSDLTAIENKEGVTLYGRVIDHKTKKLGQFEVHSDRLGHDGKIYLQYKDAEIRMNALIGVQSNGQKK